MGENDMNTNAVTPLNRVAVSMTGCEHANDAVWSTMTSIPWMQMQRFSIVPNGNGYQLTTDLATIIYSPERAENIQIHATVVIDGVAGHNVGSLTNIFHDSIYWCYKRNPTLRLENPDQGASSWSPRISARIDAESIREIFSKAYDLAMEVLLAVTDIAKSQVTT